MTIRYKTRSGLVRRSPWAAADVRSGRWDAYLRWARREVDLPVKLSFLRGFGR